MRKPCCEKVHLHKKPWSKHEDQKIIDYVNKHGEPFWPTLPQAAGLHRCGKSCRQRWTNYQKPLKKGNFAEDEEDLIMKLHALLGNRWSLIAGRLPGRTNNEVKNHWNCHMRKKLTKKGIDQNNHHLIRNLPSSQSHNGLKDNSNHCSYNYDQVSSHVAPSSELDVEEESLCIPNLNLDLTLSSYGNNIASSPSASKFAEGSIDIQNPIHESKACTELLLFR